MNSILELIRLHFNSISQNDNRANIPPTEFVAALVFALGSDLQQRTLSGIRRNIIRLTGTKMARATYWERMATKRLGDFLMFLVCSLIGRISCHLMVGKKIIEQLGISRLYILDSSSVSLPKGAKYRFPAARSNVVPAAIKWHALFDFLGGSVPWFDLTEGKTHDRNGFPPLDLLKKGSLIIFDLGYYDYFLFRELTEKGIHFLSRVKSNSVIKIEKIISGVGKKFEGRHLMKSSFPPNSALIVELLGSFHKAGKEVFSARVIGFWNPVGKTYHWYVTSLPVSAKLIYPLYRLRWQCELAFKACKSVLDFSQITTANTKIIHNLILVGIIHSLISVALGNILANKLNLESQLSRSIQRSAVIFFHISYKMFDFVVGVCGLKELKNQIKLFLNELTDPNYRKRKSSLAEVYALL